MFPRSALFCQLVLVASSLSEPVSECPLFAPSFPANFDITTTKALRSAKASFPQAIDKLFSAGVLDSTHSAFAVDVFSTTTNSSVYSYYHTGSALNGSLTAGRFDESTISRIGSVTKLFTVYALLASAGLEVFDHAVTRYLPELAGNPATEPTELIRWEDVTVGALASQQGGTGGAPFDTILCNGTSTECIQGLFKNMRSKQPVAPPFTTAFYSDGGFAILGRVLERIKGMPYNDALKSALSIPLGLNGTSSKKPTGSHVNAIALPGPPELSSWGVDNQAIASSGGVYTTAADLRRLGLSILNSDILPPLATRRWMKPLSGTADLAVSVGAPWEIYRLQISVSPNSNKTRVSDLYTKMGGNAGYSSIIALSPDHGLGYSIMIVGPNALSDRFPLRDIVGDTFLPAAEHAAMENAAKNYAGTYFGNTTTGTNLTLTVDKGHPGLGLETLFINGTDVRGNVSTPSMPTGTNFTVRLYPMGATFPNSLYTRKGIQRVSFRAVSETLPLKPHTSALWGTSLFNNECGSWFEVGFGGSNDEFTLEFLDGKVQSVVVGLDRTVMVAK